MNTLKAIVTKIDSADNLNIVSFDYFGEKLSMMSLDLNENIHVGTVVELSTKSTNIAVAKEFSGSVSYSNQIKTKIIGLEKGQLLSSVKLQLNDSVLESIITLNSLKKMDLKVGDEILAFIKASDLSILKVIS